MARTFNIPDSNVDLLKAKLAKVTKKAAKLGLPVPVVTFGEPFLKEVRTKPEPAPLETFVFVPVTAESAPVKLAGWTFVAALDHLTTEEGEAAVLIRAAGDLPVPETYRTAPAACDHCHTVRNRATTYVVRHDDGTYKVVGTSCVGDFLATDNPEALVEAAELVAGFFTVLGLAEDDGWGGDGRRTRGWGFDEFLAHAAAAIRKNGWVSRTKAREWGRPGTADDALFLLDPPPSERSKIKPEEWPNDDDRALAAKAAEWAEALTPTTDYEHNLAVVAKVGFVTLKTAGLAASVIPTYERAMGKLAERALAAKSEWVGTVGKREVFLLKVLWTKDIESFYGVTTLVAFRDPAGNRLKWFASGGAPEWVEHAGDTWLAVKATVKEHGEYNGAKETTLSRADGEWTRDWSWDTLRAAADAEKAKKAEKAAAKKAAKAAKEAA